MGKDSKEKKQEKESCCKDNIWMHAAIILGIAFVIALVFALTPGNPSGTTTGIGIASVSNLVIDLLHKNQPDLNVIVEKAEETNGVYKIALNAGGETIEVYVSIDGKLLFPQIVDLVPQVINENVDENKIYSLPITINQAPVMGNPNSKIEVLEFSDYQCPFCGMVAGSPWTIQYETDPQYGPMVGTVKKVEQLAKENKISFRQFPVAINTSGGSTESIDASNAAFCAKDQGKYWEMHDALFNAQDSEKEYTGKYAKDKLKELGAKIEGLDLIKFNECVDKDTYVDLVEAMTDDVGKAAYANTGSFGTPTFYIVLDASLGVDKIKSAAKTAGYKVAPTADKTKYIIIASPKFNELKSVLDAFAS